ncbi:MAG: glycerophosphodiester phosphodiesterase [Acidimicrobiia bacterium]|nr:glycerophosphodiester phosphodiesterase [Acidimicrobiia bacterium]
MPVPLPQQLTPGTVVAHRGNRVAERENTVAAFASAAAAGADAIELDVRRTGDDELVIHHNAIVDGVGAIIDLTADELCQAAPWIPSLAEGLAACDGMWVNVEIKNSQDDPDWDPERSVAATLADRIDKTGVIVSSFDWESAEMAKEAGWPTALLANSAPRRAMERVMDDGHRAINPHARLLDGSQAAELGGAAASGGIWIMAWTVNDPQEATRLKAAGVHAIITDDPAMISSSLG